MNFAIISEKILRKLTDRELKVYSAINILLYKNSKVTLKQLQELTGKGKTQLIEIINNLQKKEIIHKVKIGKLTKYELIIEIKYDFEIDFEIDLLQKKKIIKIIELLGLEKNQVEKIINYLKTKNPKDVVRYFNYLARNYNKIFEKPFEKPYEDQIIIEDPNEFFDFQIFLNKLKVDFKIQPIFYERDKFNFKTTKGKWIITAKKINKLYEQYKKQKN